MPSLTIYHRQTTAGVLTNLIWPVIALFLALVCLIIGIGKMNQAYARFGPAAVPAWGRDWLAAFGLLLFTSLLLLVWIVLSRRFSLGLSQEGIY